MRANDELQGANAELEVANVEAQAARAAAEAASAAKTQFLATMSHELRTALDAVLGYLDLLGLEVGRGAPTTIAGGRAARITVEDTGVGIPADRLEAVFEPFVQAESGNEARARERVHAAARGSGSPSAAGWRGSWAAT